MIQSQTHNAKTSEGAAVVTINQLPAMRSGKLLIKLLAALGPSLGAAAVAVQSGKADGFGSAVGLLGEKLTPEEFENIAQEILGPCTIRWQGQEAPLVPVLDAVFTGHVGELFKLLAAALKANYADFFDGGLGIARLIDRAKTMGISVPSPTPPKSSGPQSA